MLRSCILLLTVAGPLAAADFKAEPVEVKVPAGTLKGTLVVPDGMGPLPVAIIHAGSGPTDRDCNQPVMLKTDAFKMLAEALAAKGIATLRIDKRLIGASLKQQETDIRFDHYAEDLVAWIELVRKDKRFDRVAVIAARSRIVEGAVGMVEHALEMLAKKNIIELDEERKAAMVSNLLVVLCGHSVPQPVVNTGTIYQ